MASSSSKIVVYGAIGALLAGTVFMLREAKGLQVGEGASPDVLRDLETLAR